MSYPGFLEYILEEAFCIFLKLNLVMGIEVIVATDEALILKQSDGKYSQPGLQSCFYKNKDIVSTGDLYVIIRL